MIKAWEKSQSGKRFLEVAFNSCKGQLISKANCQAMNSSKKRTNEFIFTSMRHVFVCFLEEMEDSKKAFRNYPTFSQIQKNIQNGLV